MFHSEGYEEIDWIYLFYSAKKTIRTTRNSQELSPFQVEHSMENKSSQMMTKMMVF